MIPIYDIVEGYELSKTIGTIAKIKEVGSEVAFICVVEGSGDVHVTYASKEYADLKLEPYGDIALTDDDLEMVTRTVESTLDDIDRQRFNASQE